VVATRKAVLGEKHAHYQATLEQLAGVHQALGQQKEAAALRARLEALRKESAARKP
jgi:hypothetical protein